MDLSQLITTQPPSPLDSQRRLNIVFATAELAPYSKTGGLADVAASLPKAWAKRGHNVVVITPLYGHLDPAQMRLSRRLEALEVPRKSKNHSKLEAPLWETRMDHGVRVIFVQADEYFKRDGLYGDGNTPFEDNDQRFAFFSRAVVEFARTYALDVDVLHCNDWHTALAPLYARHYYEEEFAHTELALTIHNLAYQGTFDADRFDVTGLPKKYASAAEVLDGEGRVNFLKSGIQYADILTTVSRGYSEEIQTPEGGNGLHEVLAARADSLHGILNGADYSVWSPDADRVIPVKYDIERLNGKRQNKAALQHQLKLPVRPTLPLVGLITRLTEQKGIDILVPAVRSLLSELEDERAGFQLVVLGDGERRFHEELKELSADFPKRVVFFEGYSDEMAHRVQAGSDILVVPSRFEPCGLTQIYAMRYGTVPVVHATGGLRDTITDLRTDPETGTGFVFDDHNPEALAGALERAVATYRNYRKWRPLMVRAMEQDFSWKQSARQYEDLFLAQRSARAAE